ncbi:formyl transferase [Paramagnetospirillum kuznetsovii]|uniref:phosphoribosylglycinamide formyltransferase 1 n=2 Tax=Paramagnetospirillum kuznetsovii TaxID=2053833 RepID=A0A364NYU0_9PROT|nr:formyl transferase [Paramagnetospirillum kuznetsovii]
MMMKVLILSPYPESLMETVARLGDEAICYNAPITPEFIAATQADFIISYGYRTIIKIDIIERFPRRIVNMHIAYLPWNRGVHPNVWSWIEGTPKGVTIHFIDQGIDTGDIIVQEEVQFGNDETLDTTYKKLRVQIERLFDRHWASIRSGCDATPQDLAAGNNHNKAQGEKILTLLPQGYQTPVATAEELGRQLGLRIRP